MTGPGLAILLVLIGAAGGIGAVVRHRFANSPSAQIPWGTLAANTLATVLAVSALKILDLHGALPALAGGDGPASFIGYTAVVGLAGGMSTLSTVAGQVAWMLRQRAWVLALGYSVASLAIPSTAALVVNLVL